MPRGIIRSACIIAAFALGACSERRGTVPAAYLSVELSYAGSAACASCHEEEYELWRGSHHDLAMQEASLETVLGDFGDARFEHFGVETTFSQQDGEYRVRTEGLDGEPADFRIAYTFGVEPLQQYLVEFPGGRLQALSVAWDARPASEGGQRWMHLYPDEEIPLGDPLHWTGRNQNWNYMCAECHSTDLRKGYDAASDTYETTWAEIGVACEACHGPGSRHVAWAEELEKADRTTPDLVGAELVSARQGSSSGTIPEASADRDVGSMGLVVRLKDADDPVWTLDESGIARRLPPRTSHQQVETCGRCHSRRSVIRDPYVHGRPLLDTHRVALLTPDLYHPDGQILEEVYVYGSFLQSRMHAEGVTCSDCHDPHSAELVNEGNALCARCHLPAKYDSTEHHRHPMDNVPSAQCVACHMRAETYMVVDPRRDHSFRVPRPDLSLELGTPNACTDCHRETSPEWAAERFAEWWPERAGRPHYGQVLAAAETGGAGVGAALRRLAGEPAQPGIVRATAVDRLTAHLDGSSLDVLERAVRDTDPLVRMAVAGVLEMADPDTRLRLGGMLVGDPVLAVRIEAARSLAAVPRDRLGPDVGAALETAREELRAAQWVNGERPEAHIVLGALHAQRSELAAARAEYETALELAPDSVAARINLADLERQGGDDKAAEDVLREALALAPEDADVHHALGLTLVRQGRTDAALEELERAATLAPDNLRYGYVHAVALHSTGRVPAAIRRLEALNERWPANREVLAALANYYAGLGGLAEAEGFARRLVELDPGDAQARALLEQIRSARGSD